MDKAEVIQKILDEINELIMTTPLDEIPDEESIKECAEAIWEVIKNE